MKLTNITIDDLFGNDQKLTFLVGAGCSVDKPSCQPAGHKMMHSIINYSCIESEQEKIKKLEGLRFEQLVENVRDRFDKDLKIIDYYDLCDKPNVQHSFLAEMIKNGQFVMTTNFDYLIEHAIIQSGVPKAELIPVITREDFKRYSDPVKLLKKGKKTLYKIHGSTKNLITGEKTKDTLIATIQAFGSNKEGMNIFQVEPFKRALFDNISNNRSLVIMGYSGSDDFDVVPTLKALKNLKNVIWINFVFDDEGKEKIYEIQTSNISDSAEIDKTNSILLDIQKMGQSEHVYRVDVNTSRMVKTFLAEKQNLSLSLDNFSIEPIEFFENNLDKPDEFNKNYIPYKIYDDFNMFNDAIRCCMEIRRLAEQKDDYHWMTTAISNIGLILRDQGKYKEALKNFEDALKITEKTKTEEISAKSVIFNNMGLIYDSEGEYDKALEFYNKSLEMDEQTKDFEGMAFDFNNIGEIHRQKGNYKEALNFYKKALQVYEKQGNLIGKSTVINNMGLVYDDQGKLSNALKQYEQALKIDDQLRNYSGKALDLNNMGDIYRQQGKYDNGLRVYKEGLDIAEKIGDLSTKMIILNNIGLLYDNLEDYTQALENYELALKLSKKLGDKSQLARCLNNIGEIYRIQENYLEAKEKYTEALIITEELGELSIKATLFNNLGLVNGELKDHSEALKYYEKALILHEQLEELNGIAIVSSNIGAIYYGQKDYQKSVDYSEKALNILIEMGSENSYDANKIRNNIKIIKKKIT